MGTEDLEKKILERIGGLETKMSAKADRDEIMMQAGRIKDREMLVERIMGLEVKTSAAPAVRDENNSLMEEEAECEEEDDFPVWKRSVDIHDKVTKLQVKISELHSTMELLKAQIDENDVEIKPIAECKMTDTMQESRFGDIDCGVAPTAEYLRALEDV